MGSAFRGIDKVVADAWAAYERAPVSCRVDPALPILFFGDLRGYRSSPLRVLTVGLNPSLREFPVGSPFERFPGCASNGPIRGERYLNCLGSYFRVNPYRNWFSSYEAVLEGVGCSYYGVRPSTALHTDIASPIATNPTWSKLKRPEREGLLSCGVPVWHELLKILQPHIVFLSIAREHISKIEFAPLEDHWQALHVFTSTKRGHRRSRPYTVESRWYEIANYPSLLVFGPAAQKPFGLVSDQQKSQVGELAREASKLMPHWKSHRQRSTLHPANHYDRNLHA